MAVRTSTHSLPAQFAVSLIFVMFAYSGWNAATYVSGEMKTPERTIPASLVAGTLTVAVFYLLLNVAFIYALPLESMKGVVAIGAASAAALFGLRGGNFFSAIMSVGLLSCVSAMVIAGPRVYFAMAVDRCFFPAAARIHPKWGTPMYAVIYQMLAAVLMILTGTFESLIYYIGFALIFFAALAVAGMIRLRRREGWRKLAVVNWCYPLAPGALHCGQRLDALLHCLAAPQGIGAWPPHNCLGGRAVLLAIPAGVRTPGLTESYAGIAVVPRTCFVGKVIKKCVDAR